MRIQVKNKLFSLAGGSEVLNEQGEVIFNVKGKLFSPTKKKRIYDMQGNLLYVVRNKYFSLFNRHAFVKDANGELIAKVTNKYLKGNYIVQGQDEIEIVGTGFMKPMNIVKNGNVIGTLSGEFFAINDTYNVDVNNKEDVNFVTALIVAIDNIRDEKRKDRNK